MSDNNAQVAPITANSREFETDSFFKSGKRSTLTLFSSYRNPTRLTQFKIMKSLDEDTQYKIEFHWSHLFVAATIHFSHLLFGPFILPLLYLIFGYCLCFNMCFCFNRLYLLELLAFLWTAITFVFCIVNPEQAYEWIGLLFCSAAIIGLKTLLISLKYGFYSAKRWKEMKDRTIDREILRKEFIMRSWFNIPQEVIDWELEKSFIRQSKSPYELCVTFETPLVDSCHKYLTELIEKSGVEIFHENSSHGKNSQCYSLIVLASLYAKQISEKVDSRIIARLTILLSLIYGILPFITKYWIYGSFENDNNPSFILFAIISGVFSVWEVWGFLMFMYIGICDIRRKKLLMDECTAMIGDMEIKHTIAYLKDLPVLDMRDPRTIESWYSLRVALLDFGRKYTARVFAYISLVLPLSITMILIYILQILGIIGGASSGALISLLYLTLLCLGVITYMVFIGIETNETFGIHKDLLLNVIGNIMKENGYSDNEAPPIASIRLLNFLIKKLKQDEALRPVKIMWIRTDSALFTKIIAVLLSGIAAALQSFGNQYTNK